MCRPLGPRVWQIQRCVFVVNAVLMFYVLYTSRRYNLFYMNGVTPICNDSVSGSNLSDHVMRNESNSDIITAKIIAKSAGDSNVTVSIAPSSPVTTATTVAPTEYARDWDSGSFCSEFLHRTFQKVVPVCNTTNDTKQNSAVTCRRSPYSSLMIECSMMNVMIRPKRLYNAIKAVQIPKSGAIALIADDSTVCKSPNMSGVYKASEKGNHDHVRLMVEEAVRNSTNFNPSGCKRWVDEPSFLFQANNVHIYFATLAWYNVYKSVLDRGVMDSYKVFRIPETGVPYKFSVFEKLLFPGIEFVQNMTEETVCFKKLILPPNGYFSTLFRCKQDKELKKRCECSGKGKAGTTIKSFRTQVLKACSISDSIKTSGYHHPQKIVVILRKQYSRFPGDKPEKFHRVISNDKELIATLRKKFTTANVTSFYGEDLPMCDQIRLVHSADIYIGMHGAGLVHSWWLQDNAMLFEIVPSDQRSNVAFKMIAMQVGINYKLFPSAQTGVKASRVDVNKLVSALHRL